MLKQKKQDDIQVEMRNEIILEAIGRFMSVIISILLIAFFSESLFSCKTASAQNVPVDTITLEVYDTGNKKDSDSANLGGILKVTGYKNGSIFDVQSVYWFSNFRAGWTEIRFAASGKLELLPVKSNGAAVAKKNTLFSEKKAVYQVRVMEDVVLEYPEFASIRYQDTLIEDDRAVRQAANRYERIKAVVDWLKDSGILLSDKALFPQIPVGQMPEQFDEVIETGTLERDIEETEALFRLIYAWPELLGGGIPAENNMMSPLLFLEK